MQQTAKLYETDPYAAQFTATVLACTPAGDGWATVLDQTAFYPEGGGQPCDLGVLNGIAVTAVHTADGIITHTTTAALEIGAAVNGQIDAARRLDHMQQHTGEHILSGVLHRLFGAENVGFHIGVDAVRMDTDLPLDAASLARAEAEANAAIRADTPVLCHYPDAEVLAATPYRSKKALDGPVRLVEAGGDICACCGTHLRRTGEVGLIKILSFQAYKGGTRLAVVCGGRAYNAFAAVYADATHTAQLLSARPGHLAAPVQEALHAKAEYSGRIVGLQNALADAYTAAAAPGQPLALLAPAVDGNGISRIAAAVTAKTGAPCLACTTLGAAGGCLYALAHPQDGRALCKALNTQFAGRGGGKPGLCRGSFTKGDFPAVQHEFEILTQE